MRYFNFINLNFSKQSVIESIVVDESNDSPPSDVDPSINYKTFKTQLSPLDFDLEQSKSMNAYTIC